MKSQSSNRKNILGDEPFALMALCFQYDEESCRDNGDNSEATTSEIRIVAVH